MTIIQERLDKLDTFNLAHGAHRSFDEGVCAMELVAYIAGEPHSDSPSCTSPVLQRFLINWNDSLPTDEDRNRLIRPLLPECVGTAGGDRERAGYLALDWLVREFLPAWMDLVPSLRDHAERLRLSPEVCDMKSAKTIGTVVRAASMSASAAGDAARAAAWDAARAAAGAAAWDAARDAARDAAGAAAWDAAGAAARDSLAPTVTKLQESAQGLVRRMCAVLKETK